MIHLLCVDFYAELGPVAVWEHFFLEQIGSKSKGRSLVCFIAVKELGMLLSELARQFEIIPSPVGHAVERGEVLVREKDYWLIKLNVTFLPASHKTHLGRYHQLLKMVIQDFGKALPESRGSVPEKEILITYKLLSFTSILSC